MTQTVSGVFLDNFVGGDNVPSNTASDRCVILSGNLS